MPSVPLAPGTPTGAAWLDCGRAATPPLPPPLQFRVGRAGCSILVLSWVLPRWPGLLPARGKKPAKDPLSPHLSPPQALANSTAEYESLESEVSALHDDLWEQLNLDIQVSGIPPAPGSPTSPEEVEAPSSFSPLLRAESRFASGRSMPSPGLALAVGKGRGAEEPWGSVSPSQPTEAAWGSGIKAETRPGLCLPQLDVGGSRGSARSWGAAGLAVVGTTLTADFSPLQNEMLNRQIQKEIWRIQDVMEGLRKNNPSRGTDTAKHRGEQGPSLPLRSTDPGVPRLGASPVPCCYKAHTSTRCG